MDIWWSIIIRHQTKHYILHLNFNIYPFTFWNYWNITSMKVWTITVMFIYVFLLLWIDIFWISLWISNYSQHILALPYCFISCAAPIVIALVTLCSSKVESIFIYLLYVFFPEMPSLLILLIDNIHSHNFKFFFFLCLIDFQIFNFSLVTPPNSRLLATLLTWYLHLDVS